MVGRRNAANERVDVVVEERTVVLNLHGGIQIYRWLCYLGGWVFFMLGWYLNGPGFQDLYSRLGLADLQRCADLSWLLYQGFIFHRGVFGLNFGLFDYWH